MASASSDFSLGKSLYGRLPAGTPLDAQRLRSLLLDLASSDTELASAFSLLMTHSIFVSLLSSGKELNSAQVSSLKSLAVANLSSHLSSRISVFLDGYVSNFSVSPASPFPEVSLVHEYLPPTVIADSPSPTFSEPPTVYADTPPPFGSATIASVNDTSVSSRSFFFPFSKDYLKVLFFLISVVVLGVSFFKVKAFCEPLGLCKSSGSKIDHSRKVSKPILKPSGRPSLSSRAPSAQAFQPPVQPSTPSSNAPDRDVPLW